MVREWDDSSRGQKNLPEHKKKIKKAELVLDQLAKSAAAAVASMNKLALPPKPLGPNKPTAPTPPTQPGDYKPSFLENSGAAAQNASGDKLNAGEVLTMPVTQ